MNTIIDNATLTAVQRLLGKIPIRNKHAIDGDILAFETLIQTILFSDNVCYLDDYKKEHRGTRERFFYHLGRMQIDDEHYAALLKHTSELNKNVVPKIEGGFFTDSDFAPFFELLHMNTIFTWDLSSSEYYLTQKMLADPNNEIDIEKYTKLSQMIFGEYNDHFERQKPNKPILYDSKGRPINDSYSIVDQHGDTKDPAIGKQAGLFMASLSWLSYRTILYTIISKSMGSNLVLHPIRDAFQINFLNKLYPQSTNIFQNIISSINRPVQNTVRAILKPTEPLLLELPLPMFSVALTQETGDPRHTIEAAYQVKHDGDFVDARGYLTEIANLYEIDDHQKARKKANALISNIDKVMERICTRYRISTSQGTTWSPMIAVCNIGAALSGGALSAIPDYTATVTILDKIKDWVPQRGFGSIYKSLVNDLMKIGQLGAYHDLLTSRVKYDSDANFHTLKEEDPVFMRKKSGWKIPM
jgi:hypothetical protein